MFQHVSLCVDSVVFAPSLTCLFILFLLFCFVVVVVVFRLAVDVALCQNTFLTF